MLYLLGVVFKVVVLYGSEILARASELDESEDHVGGLFGEAEVIGAVKHFGGLKKHMIH